HVDEARAHPSSRRCHVDGAVEGHAAVVLAVGRVDHAIRPCTLERRGYRVRVPNVDVRRSGQPDDVPATRARLPRHLCTEEARGAGYEEGAAQSGCRMRLMSSAGAECVSAPTEMKS